MSDVEGYILAGGASSRMGRDKAHLRLGERTFVELIAAALASVAGKISVVSSKGGAGAWGLPVVADVYAGCGALGGLHAALAHARAPWAAVVSCDLPFVTGELFGRLASRRGAGTDAVAPRQPDGRPQPLCALYARAECLELSERLLRAGEFRPRVLLAEARTLWVTSDELSDLGGAVHFFTNVNTPEDYERARRLAGATPPRG